MSYVSRTKRGRFSKHQLVLLRSFAVVIVSGILCSYSISARADECATPLPDDVRVAAVRNDVPKEMAKFLGIWGNGKWDDVLCNTLIVEDVAPDGTAYYVYGWGTFAGWNIFEGHRRGKGIIAGGKLELTFRNGATEVKYWFEGERLIGTYQAKGRPASEITLVRK